LGIRQRSTTLHFIVTCLEIISDRLKCSHNMLGSIECLLNRLVTIHFFSVFLIYMFQRHCWFTGSCLFFASPLIFYLHVVIVLACMFVLLQFACMGFCNYNWNCAIPGGVVVVCFFLRCMLFLVVWFDFAGFRSCACSWAFWCFLDGLLFSSCSCFPRVCNVGMLHPQLDLLLHFFALGFA
jgi:hypothetical protein